MKVLFYKDSSNKVVAEVNKVTAFTTNDQNHFTFEVEGCTYTFVALQFFDVSEFLKEDVLDFTGRFKNLNRLEEEDPQNTLDEILD